MPGHTILSSLKASQSAAIIASLILFNKDGHIYIEEISKLENAIEAEK